MMDISMLNGVSVGIFGMVLSAAFCDIHWTKKKQWLMAGIMAVLMLLQGIAYWTFDYGTVQKLYPLITHIPLAIVLGVLNRKYFWSVVSVFTAYLCCQLRRWLSLLIVAVCAGDAMLQNITELVVTVPLLLLLIKFAAPSIRSISYESVSVQCQFGLIPVLGYGFDYVTRIYSDLALNGGPVIAEFMSFVCSTSYLVFVLRTSEEKRIRIQLEQAQNSLNLQIVQSVREIELLRESQRQASVYRHDLRHHMQYVSGCLESGRLEQAQEYIHGLSSEIEAGKVVAFCENEAVNLIFSAFAERAKKQGIAIKIKASIPKVLPISESDLCVLLSNGMENALHACVKLKENALPADIEVSAYEKNGKLFVQMINSCTEDIPFDHGIPVTDEPGHGIGIRSICALVERHHGIYNFSVKDGKFILRVSL